MGYGLDLIKELAQHQAAHDVEVAVGGGHILEHLVVAGNIKNAVEDRDLHRCGRRIGERRHSVCKLSVLMTAEVGQELGLADHVLAVEAANEVEPLVAAIAEMVCGERLQLSVSAAQYGVAGRRQHFIAGDRHHTERA